MTANTYMPGDTLPNGALVIANRNDVVLALRPGVTYDPYVTWTVGPDGGTYNGHYIVSLADAVEDFRARSGVDA